MKIIHTADIHLDSPLSAVANGSLRRAELLRALGNLADYAENNGVSAVIVAGDLFDDKFVSVNTITAVAGIINRSSAEWYVLKGNHGTLDPYTKLAKLCKVRYFGEAWQTYVTDSVAITGRELGNNDKEMWNALELSEDKFNVLVLHGDVDSDTYGVIDKKRIAESNVRYVALGHRHTYATFNCGKVPCCYSGVLECRGFDESASSGFVLLDTEVNKATFVPSAIRRVVTVTVDVTGYEDTVSVENKITGAVSREEMHNYLNLVLTGSTCVDVETCARNVLDGKFFALRIQNDTTTTVNLDELMQEVSLRGRFVTLAQDITDSKLRADVISLGLKALNGEDLQ